ncbi:MAG: hypothetical protein H6Q67_906 [Firmicutes bacterium]|nr:hypothetical protein [Bacillota bacterium]
MRYCVFCGVDIPLDANYCQICGKKQPECETVSGDEENPSAENEQETKQEKAISNKVIIAAVIVLPLLVAVVTVAIVLLLK